jgi:hypothetical protein
MLCESALAELRGAFKWFQDQQNLNVEKRRTAVLPSLNPKKTQHGRK